MFCRKTRPRFIGGFGVWLTLVLVGWCGSNAVAQLLIQQLLIQEVLYDGPGSDADDVFTEIVGPGGMSLQGWALVGINGENGELYRTVDLSGAAIPADGVLVVATASAAEPLLAQRDWVGSVDWQNGPDAVLLQGPQGEVVDALQYGNADPFNQGEGTPASLVPAGASLGRDALSSDTGDNAVDFGVIEMPTPGQVGADTTGQSGEGAAQGWTVTVPDTVARYGQSLSLPLRLAVDDDGGGGVAIVAAEVFLSFERDIMRLDSVTTEQTAWSLIHHVASGQANTIDTLKTALATGGQGLVGQPTLFMAHFTLVDNRAPAVAPLRLEYLLLNDGQPTATAVHGQVRRVGGSGDVTVLPKQLALPDSILVKVIDADADLDPGVADQVRVRITGSADSEELDLEETAPNSGVFKGGIAARNEMPKNSDGVVQLEHGASAQICYTDDLDATGQTIGRCVTVVQHSGHSGQIAATVVAQLGDTLRVRVADADLNTDPNLQDVVAVQVTATSFSDTLDLVLTEVGVDVGVFFGGVVLDAGGVEGIAVGRGDTVSLNYTDSRDATGQPVERQALTRVVGLFGDVDGNGRVQAFDAAKILEHMLSPVLTGVDSLAANVDSLALQGRVTAYDAALILQYRVGLRQRFPVQEDKAGNHPQSGGFAAARGPQQHKKFARLNLEVYPPNGGGAIGVDFVQVFKL